MSTTRRGFTLLELILVIALMGIITAFAVPRVRTGTDRANLSAARDHITVNMSSARRLALSRSALTRVELVGDSILRVRMQLPSGWQQIMPDVNVKATYRSTMLLDNTAGGAIEFDKRGLLRGNGASRKFLITNIDGGRDSVCVTGAGLVMRKT
ncbi:MAG TPA: type II secretion system protein, partial [Gemmatimonadaceae bacterium]|nr:type II secretion system protein [Gemmatimonadaceae bacterium]